MHVSFRSWGAVGLLGGLMGSALWLTPAQQSSAPSVPVASSDRAAAVAHPRVGVHPRGAPTATRTTDCPPVRADMQLNGTAVFQAGGGLALITAAGEPRLIKPGQQVLDHHLRRVAPGKLVFEHAGEARCLLARRRSHSTGSRATTSAQPAGPRRLAPGQYAVDRRWLTRRMADRGTLRGVRARPHLEDGRLAGFTLRRIPKDHVLRTLGLRPGDVIVGANGEAINSTRRVLELYDALPEADGVSLEVRRRGRPLTLDFAITTR